MGHQPRYTAVAIEKWVHPQQAMVGRRPGDDGFGLAKACVHLLKALQEAE